MVTSETTQDAVELLIADRRMVDCLFAQIESGSGAEDVAVRQTTAELPIHATRRGADSVPGPATSSPTRRPLSPTRCRRSPLLIRC